LTTSAAPKNREEEAIQGTKARSAERLWHSSLGHSRSASAAKLNDPTGDHAFDGRPGGHGFKLHRGLALTRLRL